jgi:ribosomal protein S18 acetylase RimI-like enzyme
MKAVSPTIDLSPVELPPIDGAGLRVGIGPLDPGRAARLGEAFAAIDPWARYPYPASALAKYFVQEEDGAPRLALTCNGEMAGIAGLRLNWLRGPYIQFLGVLPAFQRMRVGSRALAWLINRAEDAGERNMWVCASDFNVAARRFYAAHGFVEVASLPGLVCEGRDEILLRRLSQMRA